MKVAKTFGSAVYGVNAFMISIEVNIVSGTKLYIVGLPDNAIKESQHRIESALKHISCEMPRRRVIVNLAPADIRKEGASYDLPIALCILQASMQMKLTDLDDYVIIGELSLEGNLRPIKGILPIALEAKKQNRKGLVLPAENAQEATIVDGIDIIPVKTLKQAAEHFSGKQCISKVGRNKEELFKDIHQAYTIDFKDVQGQKNIKRALEIAAAGNHNLIMIGPPGAGKTMLAKRLPTILPNLNLPEALATTTIYSVAGKLNQQTSLMLQRPFRAPHHTISDVALVGGGSIPQPGEISLAHNGVLFLDELPEFKRGVLEVLRQPLEERSITITRAKISIDFPANFILIASMNPCPCGYYNHPKKSCVCSPEIVQRYLNKISGPLLDRIDLHIEVTPIDFNELIKHQTNEKSIKIKERVVLAREFQKQRFQNHTEIYANAMMPHYLVKSYCTISEVSKLLLKNAMEKLNLSARAYDKILKIARTIADLSGSVEIKENHLAEAIQFRSLDRLKNMI